MIGRLALLAAIFFGWLALGLAFSTQKAGMSEILLFTALLFLCVVGGVLLLTMGTPDLTLRSILERPSKIFRGMIADWRFNLCAASYWLVFILAPAGVVAYIAWPDHASAFAYGIGVFMVLVLIGERGFRYWKRLWKVDGL